ncbi:sulfotransferase family protein [Celeribacter sp.]|uniref:sulfotransferase family protein n=1 Tax=Celeribacter sp. TaxID=1890673 RepID=UPI003A8F9B48
MSGKTEAQIVYVYGALRSGTTAFRLMLDAHPETVNPGEFDFLFDHLSRDPSHPTGWRVDVAALRQDRIFHDKHLVLPEGKTRLDGLDLIDALLDQLKAQAPTAKVVSLNVHRNAARLIEAYPDARLIHMIRDPRDVARSSIPMGWAAHVYHGVDHWCETERDWDAISTLILPENQLLLRYEDLFSDWESELKRVCDFLDITWSPAMLSYHEHTSYAAPDPKLIAQWRHKCSMDDIALVEGKLGDLLTERGYAFATSPRTPTTMERFKLALQHKLYRWRFGTRTYGPLLYWGEKLSRKLGLSTLNARLAARISERHRATLK